MGTLVTPTTQLLSRFSFPKQPGDQPWSIVDAIAPDDYEQVIWLNDAIPIRGQLIHAQDFGLQAIDFAVAMGSNDGFWGVVIPVNFDLQGNQILVTPGGNYPAVRLMWMDQGSQATPDFGVSVMRILAIGH